MNTDKLMPKRVHAALAVVLDEFGNCDLHPRLGHFAEEDLPEEGRKLLRAWNIVETWHNGGVLDYATIEAEADKQFSDDYLA